jgi:tetratricopeptide (TPR) repeat protein
VLAHQSGPAIADLSRIVQANRATWADYCFRSFALSQQNRLDEAFVDANRAVVMAPPDTAGALAARANVAYALGKYEQALSDADLCIQRRPKDSVCYEIKANVFRALNRPMDAAQMYRLGLENAQEHGGR